MCRPTMLIRLWGTAITKSGFDGFASFPTRSNPSALYQVEHCAESLSSVDPASDMEKEADTVQSHLQCRGKDQRRLAHH
jgi:hypothetical protein